MMEEWVDSKKLYEGNVVSLRVGHALVDEKTVAVREVVEHPGGVAILPVLGDKVILVRQYRIAIGQQIIEVAAGKLEGEEEPIARARLELEEETGYLAERLIPVGSVYASVGYTTEMIHLFLAFDLKKVEQRLDFDESVVPVEMPIAGIEEQLAGNKLKDAKTILCFHALLRYLRNHPEEASSAFLDPAIGRRDRFGFDNALGSD